MGRLLFVEMVFGSHLYGTNTEKSDKDFKRVMVPDSRELFLWKHWRSENTTTKKPGQVKNSTEDVDVETFSLHQFINLACEGQTVAFDMLHAPESFWLQADSMWKDLVGKRSKFYTKNLNAFTGYARRQAAKYGIKGSRLDSVRVILQALTPDSDVQLQGIISRVNESDFIKKGVTIEGSPFQYLEVCGKLFSYNEPQKYVFDSLSKFEKSYGERAKLAAENKGLDYKAISHAIRVAYQVKELLTEGTMTFPRPEAALLVKIKRGEMDYLTEVAPLLEELMQENEALSKKSTLPEKVDRQFWDDWLYEYLERMYGN